jgi:hypothetical protein
MHKTPTRGASPVSSTGIMTSDTGQSGTSQYVMEKSRIVYRPLKLAIHMLILQRSAEPSEPTGLATSIFRPR